MNSSPGIKTMTSELGTSLIFIRQLRISSPHWLPDSNGGGVGA